MIKQFVTLLLGVLFIGCAALEKSLEKNNVELQPPKRVNKLFNLAWAKNLDPVYESGNLPIGFGSPLIVNDLLYVGSLDGHMRCFDLTNGRMIWEKDDVQPIAAKPSFDDENIYYGSRMGRLFSRNFLTGKLNYAIDLGSPVESEPAVYEGRLFVHLRNHQLVALDAKTGKVFWNYKRSVPYTSTLQRVSKPLIHANKIFVGFADGYVASFTIEEGLMRWERKISTKHKFIDVDVEPLVFNNRLVVGSANGPLTFLNLETGFVSRTADVIIGHEPILVGDHLVVGSIFGEIVKIDREGGIIERHKVTDESISSLLDLGNYYAVATMGQKLFLVSKNNNKVVEQFLLGSDLSSVFGHLQEKNGYLAVYSSRNRLYVFRNMTL